MKRTILDNLKNVYGWRTKRKLIVFSVDDYGNVRVASRAARQAMDKSGLKIHSRFDAFDALETSNDLEMLFDVLTSVRDANGHHAVFTPFAVAGNINFETILAENAKEYVFEPLDHTFEKVGVLQQGAYDSVREMWKQGIIAGLLVPQFHGREHINIKVFEKKLRENDFEVYTAIKNRSYTSLSSTGFENISYTSAFDFKDVKENATFEPIIRQGVSVFQEFYGYRPVYFNAPGGPEHSILHRTLSESGIQYIDTPLVKVEHQGGGKFRYLINFTGKKNTEGQVFLVRNVVFEPTSNEHVDWVAFTVKQVEAAFRWRRPAIISSHRVNFSGHIDPKNRKKGLRDLKQLLQQIVKRWPDVEFIDAASLANLVSNDKK